MKFANSENRDVLEVPPPDRMGVSVVRFNGCIVERVTYSDEGAGTATTEDGRIFTSAEWASYLVERTDQRWRAR